MNIPDYIALLDTLEAMKRNTRHSWLSDGRHESVAEHSWRLAAMAYFAKDEFPTVNIDKVIMMCIFHDIGEAFTGDIPAFLKTQRDETAENGTVERFVASLPEPYKSELSALFSEMNEMQTEEAKLYKALDRMEAVIQHNEADISTWLPLEYDLQLNYGEKETEFSRFTAKLKEAANEITRGKIEQAKAHRSDTTGDTDET